MKNRNKRNSINRTVWYLAFALIVFIMIYGIKSITADTITAIAADQEDPTPETSIFFQTKVQHIEPRITIAEPTASPEPVVSTEPEPTEALQVDWTITAYCSCEKCCGEWAKNRPIDPVTGEAIVVGAAGIELHAGVSVASPLPIGTVIEIEGLGQYIVQDRTSKKIAAYYNNHIVDVYFTDHQEALNFGRQTRTVRIITDGGEK